MKYVQAVKHALGAALDEHPPLKAQQANRYVHRFGRAFFFMYWQKRRVALCIRVAQTAPRAGQARRLGGRTQRGSKLHQSLIIVPGAVFGHARLHQGAQLLLHARAADILAHAVKARGHAVYVAVDGGNAPSECDAGDSARSVRPDAGKAEKSLIGIRKPSGMVVYHALRGLLQIARPAVITKPFPGLEHLLLRRGRKRFEIWKKLEKPAVIGTDGFHAGLLEHDF